MAPMILCFANPIIFPALDYYNKSNFFFISLGDSDELWENRWPSVKKILHHLNAKKIH
jgi:hypothetical protein